MSLAHAIAARARGGGSCHLLHACLQLGLGLPPPLGAGLVLRLLDAVGRGPRDHVAHGACATDELVVTTTSGAGPTRAQPCTGARWRNFTLRHCGSMGEPIAHRSSPDPGVAEMDARHASGPSIVGATPQSQHRPQRQPGATTYGDRSLYDTTFGAWKCDTCTMAGYLTPNLETHRHADLEARLIHTVDGCDGVRRLCSTCTENYATRTARLSKARIKLCIKKLGAPRHAEGKCMECSIHGMKTGHPTMKRGATKPRMRMLCDPCTAKTCCILCKSSRPVYGSDNGNKKLCAACHKADPSLGDMSHRPCIGRICGVREKHGWAKRRRTHGSDDSSRRATFCRTCATSEPETACRLIDLGHKLCRGYDGKLCENGKNGTASRAMLCDLAHLAHAPGVETGLQWCSECVPVAQNLRPPLTGILISGPTLALRKQFYASACEHDGSVDRIGKFMHLVANRIYNQFIGRDLDIDRVDSSSALAAQALLASKALRGMLLNSWGPTCLAIA
jgi:hypothetical protein